MTPKIGLAVYRMQGSRNGYKHLEFRFVNMGENVGIKTEIMELHWQSHQENGEWKPWYGCHVEVRTSDGNVLQMAMNLINRLFGGGGFWNISPLDILTLAAEKRGIRLVTYDSRLNKFVYNEDVAPQHWTCWRDADNQVHAVALDEESARDAVEKRYREIAERRYFSMDRVSEWVEAGRPVAQVDRRPGPVVYTTRQAIAYA